MLMLLAAPLMAGKKAINPPEFAGGSSPYSPGILSDGTLYVSGQIGQDLKTRQVPTAFEAEMKICMDRIGIILKAAGMDFHDVVAVQVYLTDMELFPAMNSVYATYFIQAMPARTTVGVTRLAAAGARVEITVTARR
jgi:2-iminobutanoate/2-iminopropanoate deaminase